MRDIDIEERAAKAVSLFKEGYNCSQSVFMAYSDIFGIDSKFAADISAPLGGGMGRLREVCGAVSASFLLSGLKYHSAEPSDRETKARNYAVVQDLASEFKATNGSIVCRELLGLKPDIQESPLPSERTEAYYKRRPCAEYVAIAARIIGKKLSEE